MKLATVRYTKFVGGVLRQRMNLPPLHSLFVCGCSNFHRRSAYSLLTSTRFQSSAADKKFHCSICNKSFRLEMAAKVHLQQAHGGEGSVEQGPGTPPPEGAVETPNVQPTSSTAASDVTGNVASPSSPSSAPSGDKSSPFFRPSKRNRVTPTPLYESDHIIPDEAMEAMLEVWDSIGTARLQEKFIHSSMVLKVFAAKPGDTAYIPPGQVHSSGGGSSISRTAAPIESSADRVVSPFSAESLNSPFAGKVSSPFLDSANTAAQPFESAATSTPNESSFNESAPLSPFTTSEASPFISETGASPFLMTGSNTATSPRMPMFDAAASATGVPDDFGSVKMGLDMVVEDEEEKPAEMFACSACEREFTTYEGLRMHSKAKHNVRLKKVDGTKIKPPKTPSLPAFIPSPVDLSLTKPLDEAAVEANYWSNTKIALHACAMSNMMLSGKVVAVEPKGDDITQVVVFVREGDGKSHEETLVLHCHGEQCNAIAKTLKQNDVIFSSGTLKLIQKKDKNGDYFTVPIISVAAPFGILTKF